MIDPASQPAYVRPVARKLKPKTPPTKVPTDALEAKALAEIEAMLITLREVFVKTGQVGVYSALWGTRNPETGRTQPLQRSDVKLADLRPGDHPTMVAMEALRQLAGPLAAVAAVVVFPADDLDTGEKLVQVVAQLKRGGTRMWVATIDASAPVERALGDFQSVKLTTPVDFLGTSKLN